MMSIWTRAYYEEWLFATLRWSAAQGRGAEPPFGDRFGHLFTVHLGLFPPWRVLVVCGLVLEELTLCSTPFGGLAKRFRC